MNTLRTRLTALLYTLRLTLWFLPGLMAVGGVVLYILTYMLDSHLQKITAPTDFPNFFSGGPDAARSLLSAIVASLITVIATIFSVTIVTLQLASSQYSPRLLQRFISDRLVQITLGTYAATFVYAVLVLRTVRTPGSSAAAFNPLVSAPVALIMALISVALLIYFIHHIASMSQSAAIVQAVHDDGLRELAKLEPLGEAGEQTVKDEEGLVPEEWPDDLPIVLHANKSGYLRLIDTKAILKTLAGIKGTVFVETPLAPGAYATAGLPAIRLSLPEGESLSPEEEKQLRKATTVGPERVPAQDTTFSLRQLADIALKGLSPGINDPTTTVQALNSMGSIFVALGSKKLPQKVTKYESNGSKVLIRINHPTFNEVVGVAFDQSRRAAFTGGHVTVLAMLLDVMERALMANEIPQRQEAIWERVYLLAWQTARDDIPNPYDAVDLCRQAVDVSAPLLRSTLRERVVSGLEDLANLYDEIPSGERVREAVEAATDDLKAEDL